MKTAVKCYKKFLQLTKLSNFRRVLHLLRLRPAAGLYPVAPVRLNHT